MRARSLAVLMVIFAVSASSAGCSAGNKAAEPSKVPPASSAPRATATPRGKSTWLPRAQNGAPESIEGVPLLSVDGSSLLIDGLRIGELSESLRNGRTTRLDPLFEALRSRREGWLTTHPGEAWPGVVTYVFHPETSAAVVKSVVLTSGYAACPNGSFLVEAPTAERRRVGRLAIDPLMVSEPEEKVFTVRVTKDAVVVAWRETKTTGRTQTIPVSSAATGASLGVLDASWLSAMSTLHAELDLLWTSVGLHQVPTDTRFDQVILHVDDEVPYKVLIAVVDAIYEPRRTLQVGRHEERVPALNVNLASD